MFLTTSKFVPLYREVEVADGVGESRVQAALEHGSSNKCEKYYKRDVCPWDASAMMKIVTSLITSGNIDFASIATAAAKAAAQNLV